MVYNDDLNNYINLKYNAKENDNFKNGKIFKIYKDLPNTKDVVYIGCTCDTLKKCMTNFNIKSNSKVNYLRDKFYMMIHSSYINCKIELIENFPCNNEEELKKRKKEIYVCMHIHRVRVTRQFASRYRTFWLVVWSVSLLRV